MKRVYIFKDGVQQEAQLQRKVWLTLSAGIRNWKHTGCFGRSSASLWERKNLSPIRRRRSRLRENLEWSDRRCL